MQRLEVSGAARPLYVSLGVKGLMQSHTQHICEFSRQLVSALLTSHLQTFYFYQTLLVKHIST